MHSCLWNRVMKWIDWSPSGLEEWCIYNVEMKMFLWQILTCPDLTLFSDMQHNNRNVSSLLLRQFFRLFFFSWLTKDRKVNKIQRVYYATRKRKWRRTKLVQPVSCAQNGRSIQGWKLILLLEDKLKNNKPTRLWCCVWDGPSVCYL